MLGLPCSMWAFSSCSEQELLFDAVLGLLIVGASLVVEHGLGKQATVVVARGLSCPEACGIFPSQGSNPCPLHWKTMSLKGTFLEVWSGSWTLWGSGTACLTSSLKKAFL